MPSSIYQPDQSIQFEPGLSPQRNITIGASSITAGLLVVPSTGTYGNGVALSGANCGSAQATEAFIESVEIPSIHPGSGTPYDIATAFTTGDPANGVQHVCGKNYWLKGSSVSTVRGSKIIPIASGLVKVALAHTATPLPMHMWGAIKIYSSATWVLGTYLGIVSSFTA